MQTAEHLIELQTVSNFMEYTMGVPHPKYGKKSPSKLNRKPPYNSNTQSHVACGVWVNDFQYGFLAWNNKYKDTPQTSFFKLLGSSSNAKHMVNCEKKLNNLKGSVCSFLFLLRLCLNFSNAPITSFGTSMSPSARINGETTILPWTTILSDTLWNN